MKPDITVDYKAYTLPEHWPGTDLIVNGWHLTGRRVWTSGWEAECTCGATTGFDSIPRFLSNTKHCKGCNWGKPNMDRALAYHYGIYRSSARRRNIDFELDMDEFLSLVLRICHYCGEVQEIKYKTYIYLVNGIDRIDNTLGYVMGNVRTCCRDCNVAKGTMTETQFIQKVVVWNERLAK